MTRIAVAAALLGSALTFGRVAVAAEADAAPVAAGGHVVSVPDVIFEHVADGRDISFENPITGATASFELPEWKVTLGSTVVDLSLTRHTVFLWLAMVVVIVGVSLAARKRSLVPRGFYSVVEVFVKFVREELAEKNIGKGSDTYVPYLTSLFFVILTANLIGLIPFASTATANINVTVGLAFLTFVVTLFAGMKGQGVVGFWTHIVPQGVPLWLYPIMLPVEILSMLTKPFALTIRLFANMVAGHIVLFFLLGLIFLLQGVGPFIAPVSVAFATGVYFLELFVALLQAYIFTMLSALFIGMASHSH